MRVRIWSELWFIFPEGDVFVREKQKVHWYTDLSNVSVDIELEKLPMNIYGTVMTFMIFNLVQPSCEKNNTHLKYTIVFHSSSFINVLVKHC